MTEQIPILADTHVHLYPDYDLCAAFQYAGDHLTRRAHDFSATTEAAKILLLTERHDCHVLRTLRDGPSPSLPDGFGVKKTSDEDAVTVDTPQHGVVHVIGGRQVVTKERIEVLALTVDADISDGQPIRDTLEQVSAAGAVPVLSWAPGKWFFGRGRIVRELVATAEPGRLALGDTTLRPILWGTPRLMRLGQRRGLRVIAGSDPLPFAGEESCIGRYVTAGYGPFDATHPATSMRAWLSDPQAKTTLVGQRDTPGRVARRLQRNQAARSRG